MDEKLSPIFQRNEEFRIGDVWELVLTEEFVKNELMYEKLTQLL